MNRRQLVLLVGLVLGLALLLGPAPAGAAILGEGGNVTAAGGVFDNTGAFRSDLANPPTVDGCWWREVFYDDFGAPAGTSWYGQVGKLTITECTRQFMGAEDGWRLNGTATATTTTTTAPAATTTTTAPTATTAPATTTAPTTAPPTTAPATTTTAPLPPPPPSCASPGPSTVQEAAACDTAAQADKGRAEMLLGLCLIVLLQAAALAVGLWR